MTTAMTMFVCPGCGAETPAGTPRCERCRIHLNGELAMQLWRLDQQLSALTARRAHLVDLLRRDDAPVARPTIVVAPAPGTETRRLLLVLGVLCVIAALSAATALIWPALGPGGQTALLVVVTSALLVAATRLERLPATAEALASIGVAATAIDVIAGRRLVVAQINGATSHAYWIAAAVASAAALALVSMRARWLHAPAVGAVVATFGALFAVAQPRTASAYAVLGLTGVAIGLTIAWFAALLRMSTAAVRATALAGTAAFATVTEGASFAAAVSHSPALWCGVALGGAFIATRLRVAAIAGGLFAGLLLVVGAVVPAATDALTVAGVAAAVLLMSWWPPRAEWTGLARDFAVGLAGVAEVAAQMHLQLHLFRHAYTSGAAGLLLLAVVLASAAWLAPRDEIAIAAAAGTTAVATLALVEATAAYGADVVARSTAGVSLVVVVVALGLAATAVRPRWAWVGGAVGCVAALAATAATAGVLWLNSTRLVEAYVVVPAVLAGAIAVVAMKRLPGLTSWALGPAILIATLPSLLLALDGDTWRQVLVVGGGALLVMAGAQWRLASPMVCGAAAVTLVALRVVGPQVAHLPRWLSLGVAGAALLVLGATWEKRLQQVRVTTERLRPMVAALR